MPTPESPTESRETHGDGNGTTAATSQLTAADLAALVNDRCARTILAETRQRQMPAAELIESCDASRPTVYRRLTQLERAGLVETTMEYDSDGHHRRAFRALDREITIDLEETGFSATVD